MALSKPSIPWSATDGTEKILSIDVGVTHLAYLLMDYTNVRILQWDVVDLKALSLVDNDNSITHIGIRPAKRGFTNVRATDILAQWLDTNIQPIEKCIQTVLIEQQLTGQMRCISHELQIYFRCIAKTTKGETGGPFCIPSFMSPKLKNQLVRAYLRESKTLGPSIPSDEEIRTMTRSQRYTLNKKLAVMMVKDVLTETHPWRAWFMAQETVMKVDDLADVLVQCLAYIQLRTEDENERNKRKQLGKERAIAKLAQKTEERKRLAESKEAERLQKEAERAKAEEEAQAVQKPAPSPTKRAASDDPSPVKERSKRPRKSSASSSSSSSTGLASVMSKIAVLG